MTTSQTTTVGIILAAGKGTRLKSTDRNKTSLLVAGKPLVVYGVELYKQVVDTIIVVVGAFAQSVKDSITDSVLYVVQDPQQGTGQALQIAVHSLKTTVPDASIVFVGHGDHMMHYTVEILGTMKELLLKKNAAIVMATTTHPDPNSLAWGRVICGEDGRVLKIVEQKDASEKERAVNRINPAMYCFSAKFLFEYIDTLVPSPVTGEYYLTDLIEIAVKHNLRVESCEVPFSSVGTGVNTPEQLEQTDKNVRSAIQ